ncbi:MAG TPA: SWIM zinc finger family protein [Planctomycetaceae bacterium]|nr:SWIM zinc finger family protein [Planctomycetaceae bacterium]
MPLNPDQIKQMAPDASAAAAGQKLASAGHWQVLGRDSEALWGLCKGSAVYQVRVDLSNLGYRCSCPSRKLPCKHVLGLLLLSATSAQSVAEAVPPEWVVDWMAKRKEREQKKAEPSTEAKPVDEKAQKQRIEKREARIDEGLGRLDLWLKDLVRNGFAGLESKPPAFWHDQAKRLVDAQVPGLATRVQKIAEIPGSSTDWPSRLADSLGRLKLLIHAYQGIDRLAPDLQLEIRQTVGWTLGQSELDRDGEAVEDEWAVIGQWLDEDDRVRTQRSWLLGRDTRRRALVLQFSVGQQPFEESIIAGTQRRGTLVFYPGVSRQRAKFRSRSGSVGPVSGQWPGALSIDEFLGTVAELVARQPWLTAFGELLRDVTISRHANEWYVCDRNRDAIPLLGNNHWKLLALSGADKVDLAGEWEGSHWRPLGVLARGKYTVL